MIKISDATRRYVLGVLVVVYTFNFIDRQILSILLEPIKTDLGLSDTQIGLLTGFAFAAFYATLGMPIARFADRSNRRNLIALSLTVWSAMTALSGVAMNFWHLLIARIGVGVGEAGCSPSSHSIISDYYPAQSRATALGIYSLGIPVRHSVRLLYGRHDQRTVRLARPRSSSSVFPGSLLALLVRFTVREPPRGMAEGRTAAADQPGVVETLTYPAGEAFVPASRVRCGADGVRRLRIRQLDAVVSDPFARHDHRGNRQVARASSSASPAASAFAGRISCGPLRAAATCAGICGSSPSR